MARPSGARPQPQSQHSSSRRESNRESNRESIIPAPLNQTPEADTTEVQARSSSALSHNHGRPTLSNNSSVTSRTSRQLIHPPYLAKEESEIPLLKPSDVVPTATYIERGQRWMEKEEAVSLREAMEDMDLKEREKEEARIQAAAQDEASELVWEHQNPGAVPVPGAPYRYIDHLRKNSYQHARTQSVGRYGGAGLVTGLARDITPRSVSGESTSSEHSRTGSPERSGSGRLSLDSVRESTPTLQKTPKTYGSMSSRHHFGSSRKTSGKRNISGEIGSIFTGEQIYEEPEDEDGDRGRPQEARDIPAPLHIGAKPRNPLSRVQFSHEVEQRSNSTPPESAKRLSYTEIYRNPPSQSRNPNYTKNPPPPKQAIDPKPTEDANASTPVLMKDGKEIRSEEIREATSMRLKDRSPKLPTPTAVSDRPGRPIVSFDENWKPKQADVKPEVRRRSPFDRISTSTQRQSLPARSDSKTVTTSMSTIHIPDPPSIKVEASPIAAVPTINLPPSTPSVPIINLPDSTPSIPIINLPDSEPSIPTINLPDTPCISVSAPEIPSINISSEPPNTQSKRPLPDPKTAAGRNPPRPLPRGHWSPAAGKRATATCHQCQLPIEGRVVKLSGAPEHFHPHCFICFTCGTGLESLEIHPEPPAKRAERIDRIQRRAKGEVVLEIEGQTIAEDGDERLRYFCHLDWHEAYAPKCKHCKTPIIGEHTVALGEHWHYGHFFCAECGDPFEKGMTHIEKDGYAWCLNCQTKRTERRAPKCKKCKKPVIGEYVQALGGEWHEKCFRCATCHSSFDDGSFYPKEVGSETVVLCISCIERELKA